MSNPEQIIAITRESSDIGPNECVTEDRLHDSVTKQLDPGGDAGRDFSIIWQDLTYRVDTRTWASRIRDRLTCNDSPPDNLSIADCGMVDHRVQGNHKVIFNQICGSAKSRELTAILGPSGAGKSTLLSCLFQNRTIGTTGRILCDSHSDRKPKVCFIPQKDYLNEFLTVWEDLIFVSKLRLAKSACRPSGYNQDNQSYVRQDSGGSKSFLFDHEANVNRVSNLLGLSNCLDVLIKNISGGQKKRLSVARELMSDPDILVLDEPTTGQDSLTCYKTVTILRNLVRQSPKPIAVIMTIHQPQKNVFNMFDRTYFISNTGRVIYDGTPKNAVAVIEGQGKVRIPAQSYNPASFLIELGSEQEFRPVVDRLANFQRKNFFERYDPHRLDKLMTPKSGFFGTSPIHHPRYNLDSSNPSPVVLNESSSYELTKITQDNNESEKSNLPSKPITDYYYISHQLSNCLAGQPSTMLESLRHSVILTHRSWLSCVRNPSLTRSRLAFHILLPLSMVAIFGTNMGSLNNCPKIETELDLKTIKESLDNGIIRQNTEETRYSAENVSFYFILLYGFSVNIVTVTASVYPTTMHMFKKEVINGLYSPTPYYIGHMLAELPFEIFFPSISIILSYSLTGQQSSYLQWRMFVVAYVVCLVSYSMHALGLLAGSISINNVSFAVLIGQVAMLPFLQLSGFLMRLSRMPDWLRLLSQLSPFKHGMTAIVVARYGFNVCECDQDTIGEDGLKVEINGLTPQVKHVMDYMFPRNASNSGEDYDIAEMFDKLGAQFVRAQTYALDIKSCKDVKPYVMHIWNMDDSDLFTGILLLIAFIAALKIITFSIVKSFPYRMK